MKKFIYPILLMFVLIQCSKERSANFEIDLQFEETLVLGSDDEEAANHDIFRMATHAVADERGWIYAVNSGEASVRVYNEQGDYQRSFGSEGAGPGEFNTAGAILIDSEERFLIVDPTLSRVSAYTLEASYIEAFELPSVTRVRQIAELADGLFVIAGQHHEQMIHIVDSEFSRIESSLAATEDLLGTNERLERVVLQFFPGSVTVLPDDSIVYAPALYGGELFVYRPDNQGNWNLTDTIQGHSPHRNPASFSTLQDAGRADLPIMFPDEGRYAAQFHSLSQGVHYVAEKGLFHFSVQETDEQGLTFIVEKFSESPELEGFAKMDSMDTHEMSMLHMDVAGNIYLSDSRGFPKLRRLSIGTHD